MKRFLIAALLVFAFCLAGCGTSHEVPAVQATETVTAEADEQTETENKAETEEQAESEQLQPVLQETSEGELQIEEETTDMIKITVGSNSFYAKLEDNASASELRELLQNGPITMSASNYGGFEKVCSLGTRLASNDVQTTTQAGDIMLYSSSQIVIFYGSNSWAYTRLAKVVDEDIPNLRDILSGSETEVIIELAAAELR